jgi:hypothetical protein
LLGSVAAMGRASRLLSPGARQEGKCSTNRVLWRLGSGGGRRSGQ